MKSIQLLTIVIAMLAFTYQVDAQSTKQDAVYLKNGSILFGRILENMDGKQLRIEIIGHNQLVIPYSDIETIEKEVKKTHEKVLQKGPIEVINSIHFYGGSRNSGGFSVLASYRFPCQAAVGLGSGIDIYNYELLPVFTEIDYYFLKGPFNPFLYGRAGLSFPLSKAASDQWNIQEYKMGTLAGVGAGLRMNLSSHTSFIFSAGYRYQKTRMVSSYPEWYSGYPSQTTERIDEFNRINISLGIILN